jgi:ABC-type amino acid transport substrate-binding protein
LEIDRSAPDADALVAAVRSGKVDVGLGQIADTLDRARVVRFSRPYLHVREVRVFDRVALARAGGEGAYLARPSLRVAVTAGSAFAELFRIAYPSAEVVGFLGVTEALAEVAAGRAAVFVADEVSLARWWKTHPASAIHLETVVHSERNISYAAAVHWRAERLQAWLNLFLDKCERDGTFAGLRARHLQTETSAEETR